MPSGRFCWYDLRTNNVEGGKDFYTKIIGWGLDKWPSDDFDYAMWTTPRGAIGGVAELSKEAVAAGAPPHWLAYVEVEDIGGTLGRAQELGASILVPETEIPEAGHFAIFADPQGAVLALFKSTSGPSEGNSPSAMDFSWHELMTSDHHAALEFYSTLFGWQSLEVHEMAPGMEYLTYGQSGDPMPIGGMYTLTEDMPSPPAWVYYVTVDDIDSTLGQVKDHKGTVLNGPMEVPGGDRVAWCQDPQGAFFALHELATADA